MSICKQLGRIRFHWVAYMNFQRPKTATKVWGCHPRGGEAGNRSSRWKFKNPLGGAICIQSIDTKYRYVTISWLAVGGRATDGLPHFLTCYICTKTQCPKQCEMNRGVIKVGGPLFFQDFLPTPRSQPQVSRVWANSARNCGSGTGTP